MRAAATERGLERAIVMLSSYVLKMGAESELLDLAKTVNFESMHVLTRGIAASASIGACSSRRRRTFESNAAAWCAKLLAKSDTVFLPNIAMAAVLFHRSSV